MGKKMILFISPEIIFTAFSLNNINIIMEQLVEEDIDNALMDIDVETENTSTNIDLEDLGTKRRYGTDTARNQARNIFDKFLKYMKDTNNQSNSNHIFNSLHEVEAANKSDYIEQALIGVFADWLVKVYRAKSLKYAEKILSCVKMVLLITFPNLTIFNANDLWYTGLRGKLKQAYYTKCAENNTSVVGSPSKMEPEDLEILTNM